MPRLKTTLPKRLTLALVLIATAGCQLLPGLSTNPLRWWESPSTFCPDNPEFRGEAPSSPVVAPFTEAMSLEPAHRLRCVGDGPAFGSEQTWFENGQTATRHLVYRDGTSEYTEFDPLGRVLVRRERGADTIAQHWWHEHGEPAVSGQWRDQRPDGEWSEWDVDGNRIGHVRYDNGVAGPVTGSSQLLAYLPTFMDPVVQGASATDLPSATSGERFDGSWQLAVTHDQLSFSGKWVANLTQGELETGDVRGMLHTPLYEEMYATAQQMRDLEKRTAELAFEAKFVLFASADLSWTTMRSILFTANYAGFDSVAIVTQPNDLTWPPRTGIDALRGGPALATLTAGLKPGTGPCQSVQVIEEQPYESAELLFLAPVAIVATAWLWAAVRHDRGFGRCIVNLDGTVAVAGTPLPLSQTRVRLRWDLTDGRFLFVPPYWLKLTLPRGKTHILGHGFHDELEPHLTLLRNLGAES